ncbi:hypothetical protein [Marinobacterium iners]|uniref:hypothetical protein n=1 Tax=Marinobacterium iners TaxID=48076 RepID=UPI001A90BE07|nr:hypothetical protein [Marinobacterium iners]
MNRLKEFWLEEKRILFWDVPPIGLVIYLLITIMPALVIIMNTDKGFLWLAAFYAQIVGVDLTGFTFGN